MNVNQHDQILCIWCYNREHLIFNTKNFECSNYENINDIVLRFVITLSFLDRLNKNQTSVFSTNLRYNEVVVGKLWKLTPSEQTLLNKTTNAHTLDNGSVTI